MKTVYPISIKTKSKKATRGRSVQKQGLEKFSYFTGISKVYIVLILFFTVSLLLLFLIESSPTSAQTPTNSVRIITNYNKPTEYKVDQVIVEQKKVEPKKADSE